MKKLTVKNKLVHVDVFIFHIDNNLTDLKHHFKQLRDLLSSIENVFVCDSHIILLIQHERQV